MLSSSTHRPHHQSTSATNLFITQSFSINPDQTPTSPSSSDPIIAPRHEPRDISVAVDQHHIEVINSHKSKFMPQLSAPSNQSTPTTHPPTPYHCHWLKLQHLLSPSHHPIRCRPQSRRLRSERGIMENMYLPPLTLSSSFWVLRIVNGSQMEGRACVLILDRWEILGFERWESEGF